VINITKTYQMGQAEVRALNGVSFDIHEGELTAIIGASGSGKSTLMHILGCLDTPTAGRYLLNGRDVSMLSGDEQAAIRNGNIGFVFQTFNLLPRLSALENVELPLLYAGNHDAKDRAMAALKIVGLEDRAAHEPNQLSGGQRQRVAIARALINDPKVIFADEPTGNLDSKTGIDILETFAQLHAAGRTIIMVTHDSKIAQFCARHIRISDGEIVEDSAGHGAA
jgi:putative ABC transport system ATP-binding protein